MLHRRHPAVGHVLREAAIFLVVDVELAVLLAVVDRGTPVGIALDVEHRAVLRVDVPRELHVRRARPLGARAVVHLVLDADRVAARTKHVGLGDRDARAPSVQLSGTRSSEAPGARRNSPGGAREHGEVRRLGPAVRYAQAAARHAVVGLLRAEQAHRGLPGRLSRGYWTRSARTKSPPCRLMSRSSTSVTTRMLGWLAVAAAAGTLGSAAAAGAAAAPVGDGRQLGSGPPVRSACWRGRVGIRSSPPAGRSRSARRRSPGSTGRRSSRATARGRSTGKCEGYP